MPDTYEIRDPVHGFIEIDEWEKDIINHKYFQRLRRIRQLSWTDMVYPSANHTRFEHSLGVMHIATKMFDQLVDNSRNFLIEKLNYDVDDVGVKTDRKLLRLTALLHDVGHPPFSHSSEALMPIKNKVSDNSDEDPVERFNHEDYSCAIIEHGLKDVIENHPYNDNYHIKAEDIKNLLEGNSKSGRRLIWKTLISSQLDADRADYLLRDAYHIGARYGEYDLYRLLNTLTFGLHPETGSPTIAIEKGGKQVAESFIIARYLMFTQVYFHHTRRAFDMMITNLLENKLQGGSFPPPTQDRIQDYLEWDDWKVGGIIKKSEEKCCKILKNRKHYRSVFETSDNASIEEIKEFKNLLAELREENIKVYEDESGKSWYKTGTDELYIKIDNECIPLSEVSNVVKGMQSIKKYRIYVPSDEKQKALNIIKKT